MTKNIKIVEIKNIVHKAIKDNNPTNFNGDILLNTSLFGSDGFLDSLGLVTLLVNIEQEIEAIYDIALTIADEKALSQSRSPFRSVDSLVEYLDLILNEKNE